MSDLSGAPVSEVVTAALIVQAFPALIAAWKSVGTLLPRTTDEKLAATWAAIGTFLWFWADHGGCDTLGLRPGHPADVLLVRDGAVPRRRTVGGDSMNIRPIHVSRLVPHPLNVRASVGDVTELAASIRVHGILQPLVAEERPDGKYTVLAGHRRLAAARKAGLETVPVDVRPAAGGAKAIEVMLVENCQRADLSPVEKAEAMGTLRSRGYSAASIARATGLSASTVSYYLSILDLDEASRGRIKDGTVPVGHAIKAVRAARKQRRGGTTGRAVQASPPWLTRRHRLAAAAGALCDHRTRPLVGDVACGQCWEQAIRDDERGRLQPAEPEDRPMTVREGRAADYFELRSRGYSRQEAALRLGITVRSTHRYDADPPAERTA